MFENFSKKTIIVLNLFLDQPDREFYIREVAKHLKISTSTAKNALDCLKKEGMLEKKKKANALFYRFNTENNRCIEIKKARNMESILKSSIVKKLEKQNPTIISITLFGSYAKGDNTTKSDIDLLVISQKKTNYTTTELGGTEINIIQYTPAEWNKKAQDDKPFYNDIKTTGKPLKGMLPEV